MSRSALWRQEGAKKEQEKQAEELFQLAVEEGRNVRARNILPLWGPDDSFHLPPMLLESLIKSSYFQKCCRDLTNWNALVDEIYYQVQHVQPWNIAGGHNREPSAAFCLLLRLMTLRCTTNQMELQLDHPDSPYIRAIGFLYLRFVGEPQTVYQWIEPYLYDEESIHVTANSQKKSHHQQQQQSHRHGRRQGGPSDPETIGDFVRKLFSEREYYGIMLPRLPIHIERDIQVKLLLAEKNQRRAQKHLADEETMSHFQRVGAQVMALYGDEENPIQWYEAVVDRVITRNEETSRPLKVPKFVVTFPEYGNTETVSLGDLERRGVPLDAVSSTTVPSSSVDPFDHGDGRRGDGRRYGDSSNYGGGRADLYDEVRKREQERVTAKGKNAIARRPPSAKASLAAPITASTRRSEYGYDDRRSPTGRLAEEKKISSSISAAAELLPNVAPPRERKRTTEEIAAIQEKKRKLMAKYG